MWLIQDVCDIGCKQDIVVVCLNVEWHLGQHEFGTFMSDHHKQASAIYKTCCKCVPVAVALSMLELRRERQTRRQKAEEVRFSITNIHPSWYPILIFSTPSTAQWLSAV